MRFKMNFNVAQSTAKLVPLGVHAAKNVVGGATSSSGNGGASNGGGVTVTRSKSSSSGSANKRVG